MAVDHSMTISQSMTVGHSMAVGHSVAGLWTCLGTLIKGTATSLFISVILLELDVEFGIA